MALTLPTLPVEVIELIAHTLEPSQLFSLRLVCKQLQQKTLYPFGKCFTTFPTDLSRRSLKTLQLVSQNAQLQQCVQTLLIGMVEDDILGGGFQWHQHSPGHTEAPLPGLEKLQDILVHNLPNCRSFHIKSGSQSIEESDAIGIILSIITRTSLPVKSFIVDFSSGVVDEKRLQMWQYRQPSFRSGWSHVQELSFVHVLASETFDWAIDLIVDATSLRKLSLAWDFGRSASFIERLCSSNALHGLQSFSLDHAHVASDKLSELLVRSRYSLRALSFRHVAIESGSDWPTVLGQLSDQLPFLENISMRYLFRYRHDGRYQFIFPSLSSNPVVPGSGGRRFTLKWGWRKRESKLFGVDYQGPGVDKALKMLMNAAEVL